MLRCYYQWLATIIEYKQDAVVYEVPLSQIRNAIDQPSNGRYFIETANNGSYLTTASIIPQCDVQLLAMNRSKNISVMVDKFVLHTNNVELKFNARYSDVRLFTSRKRYSVVIDGIKWEIVTEKVYGCPTQAGSTLLMFSGSQCKRFSVAFTTLEQVTEAQIRNAYQHLVPQSLRVL